MTLVEGAAACMHNITDLHAVVDLIRDFCYENELLEPNDEVVVCISFGKDSIAMYYLLHELRKEMGISLIPLLVTYPRHRFSNEFLNYLRKVIPDLNVVVPEQDDYVLAKSEKPCEVCKLVRRETIKEFVIERGFRKVATAHTLWDLIAYLIELLFLTNFHLERALNIERGVEVLSRFLPKYRARDGVTVIHPLLVLGEDVTEYIATKVMRFSVTPRCTFSALRPKRKLAEVIKVLARGTTYRDLMSLISKCIDMQQLRSYVTSKDFHTYLL
ncbi:MAG: hypothetical protein DRJ40_10140 [Thermoprotei archaeon]|nr:MAG: hypothetical protein DRJ40_10140 [Thermoprotei archaeon]